MCKCCPRKAVVCIAFTHRLLEYYYYYFFLHLHLFCLFSISLYYSSQLFLSYECHYLLTDHFFLSSFIICLSFFLSSNCPFIFFLHKNENPRIHDNLSVEWSGVPRRAAVRWSPPPQPARRRGWNSVLSQILSCNDG